MKNGIVAEGVYYVGVDDAEIDLFEGQYVVEKGMAYNSYVIVDEKIAVMDSVDAGFGEQWLEGIAGVVGERTPDYLVVHHMEPDHSSNIVAFMEKYPEAVVVASAAAFKMMQKFYGVDYADRRMVVKPNAVLELGTHTLTFASAAQVHWPEVMVSYDAASKILFSADAFGKFGVREADEDWACEARRYYFGIVGKFGKNVEKMLGAIEKFDIEAICSLHGPILDADFFDQTGNGLDYHLNLYKIWSSYGVESEGVCIAYTSVYGHTREAADLLAARLEELGCPKVALADLARDDMDEAVEDAFRYGKLVLATTTYNGGVFPFMCDFIERLVSHGYQKRTIGLVENGAWAPTAAKGMRAMLEGCSDIEFAENVVTINAALDDASRGQIEALAQELMA